MRESDSKKRLKARERYSRSAVQEIKDRVDEIRPKTLSSSPLVKAMNYMTNQWNHLTLFLEDGNIPIDNNMVENTIRPFVVGRKNWLFNDSQKGASASAFFYSLIQFKRPKQMILNPIGICGICLNSCLTLVAILKNYANCCRCMLTLKQ